MIFTDAPTEAELSAAAHLWRLTEHDRLPTPPYEDYFADQERGFLEAIQRPQSWVTLAIRDGQVIGLVAGFPADDAESVAAWLAFVAVAPAHRRQGVGAALIGHGQRRALELGARRLSLTVHETNVVARALYEEGGWQPTGATQSTPLDDELLVEYYLDL